MIDVMEDKPKRFFFCEHCGGDKPWARTDWVMLGSQSFCSVYCKDNFLSYLAKRGKKLKTI